MCDSLDSHSCSGVQIGGLSKSLCFIHERSCSIGETVLELQSTLCSGVWAGSVPLSQGQEGWSSVPALECLKPYKNT